jgi:hypothetical protein
MSSEKVVFNCATCCKTISCRQHFAICASCSIRVHRKCIGKCLSNNLWDMFRQTFTCSTCKTDVNADKPVPVRTIKYEIMIGASQKSGDIVSDGCGYMYSFQLDYPNLRVWRCTFREFCNSTLKQIKRPGIDFLRNHSQEDFTLNAEKAHSHPPNYVVEKQQLTVGQSCSTSNGPSFNLGNISTAEPAPVEAAKRTRCHTLFDSSTREQSNNT